MNRTLMAGGALVAGLGIAAVPPPAGGAAEAARGSIHVFARIPAPGYPALTLVSRHRVYVGTFTGVAGGTPGPSTVFAYSHAGRLQRTYRLRGQTPDADNHAVQVAARDRRGRLYLLDQTPPRVVRLNPRTGRQRTWARFPDLPTCQAANRPARCSNTLTDNPPEPDYAAWLPDGSMLVTDYAQQLIWRVGRHGGTAHVWINDARFDGEDFGPAGILLAPGHRSVYLTVSAGGVTTSRDPTTGKLYRIGIDAAGRPTRIRRLWSSGPGQAPDGFALSRHGHLYVALSGPSGNQVVELARRAGGYRAIWRVPSATEQATSPVPWDTSTSVQFLGRSILVTNQAYFTGDRSHMVVFRIPVGERGQPVFVPRR